MNTIKEVLMRRDGLTAQEADESIAEAVALLADYLERGDLTSAEDICAELWGLEPDYIMELI